MYLDTAPLPDGMAVVDIFPPEARRHIEGQVRELSDGWRLPVPPRDELSGVASHEGLDNERLGLLLSRAVAQPFGTCTQPLRLENPAREALPKVGIQSSFSLDQAREMIDGGAVWANEFFGPQWQCLKLLTGHWPMFSRPDVLAKLLLNLLSGVPDQDGVNHEP